MSISDAVQESFNNASWLDELGIHLSLPRFPSESFSDYKKRLYLQARNSPGFAEQDIIKSVNRLVALFEDEIFRLELVLDANGDSVAPDPYVEIDGVFLRIWSDYANGTLDLELDIWNRDGAYFLKDVYSSLTNLSFLTLTIETKKEWEYLRSFNLVYGNSNRYFQVPNLVPTGMNELPHTNIRSIDFYSSLLFLSEVASPDLITKEGEYHVDYKNGLVFTYEWAMGGAVYTYRKFPYSLMWQPVKMLPLNAESIEHLTKDYLVNPDGQNERLLLNPYGAQIANETLAIHPLQWGK